jgi:hypothetical protein
MGVGRQPAIGETRATALIIRCTAAERHQWQQLARAKGLTVSDLVRRLLDQATSRESPSRLSDSPMRKNASPQAAVVTPRGTRKARAR